MPLESQSSDEISVAPDRIYVAAKLFRLLEWKDAAQRKARRLGLTVRYFGGRRYILGRDLIEFLVKHGKESKDA